jgi:hypothetical protein
MMTGTTFITKLHRPLAVDETITPILFVRPRQIGRILKHRLDALDASVDRALDEASVTPVLEGIPELRAVAPVGEDDVALRDRALVAINEICTALSISETKATLLVGVARNTVASWRRRERTPYPATVRKLFEVHSLVSAATALFGRGGAQRWFIGFTNEGPSRLEVLRTPAGIQVLAGELRALLVRGSGAPALPTPAEFDRMDEEELVEELTVYAPDAFAGSVVRPRQVP